MSGHRVATWGRGKQKILTLNIANIANLQGDLLSAQWVLGKQSRCLWRCKPKVGLVHHTLRWSSRLPNHQGSQYGAKTNDLRGISAAAHIAFATRSPNGTLYETVAADCEEKLAVTRPEDDQTIGVDDNTYSIGRCILNRQA